MCGICGIVSFSGEPQDARHILPVMSQRLAHRGPDDEGFYYDDFAGLGNRRLSIIDLEGGHQPIPNEDQSLWLVYNGEIYNFRELRQNLVELGHSFATQTDSEVIVHAYEEYGDQFATHLSGMYAFALWDRRRKRLILGRDRLGIKPLYYFCEGRRLIFGSELKALISHPEVPRDIDPVSLDSFLTLEYIPADRSIFRDIHKVPAGHLVIFGEGGCTVQSYWDLAFEPLQAPEGQLIERLEDLVRQAVSSHLVSDVPVGAFLSGGIDSSTVVRYMHESLGTPFRTFSIGFDDASYNELPDAEIVATHFGTDHLVEVLHPSIAPLAEKLIGHLDEPLADFSIFPTYLVAELASRHVKVVLSGDGGDEIFGGYDTYLADRIDALYRWLPAHARREWLPNLFRRIPPQAVKKGLINRAKRFVEGAAQSPELQHARWMIFLSYAEKWDLYGPALRDQIERKSSEALFAGYFQQFKYANPITQQQFVDIKTYLADNILTKVDRMSMANSLEVRVPLLDHHLVEFAINLPPRLKLHRGQTKVILRKAMRGQLPARALAKPKQGFSIPMKNWLRGPLKSLMQDLLSSTGGLSQGYFNSDALARWQKEHLERSADHSHRLWASMVFILWCHKLEPAGQG